VHILGSPIQERHFTCDGIVGGCGSVGSHSNRSISLTNRRAPQLAHPASTEDDLCASSSSTYRSLAVKVCWCAKSIVSIAAAIDLSNPMNVSKQLWVTSHTFQSMGSGEVSSGIHDELDQPT
jgi:hypothetical protein